MRAGGVDDAGAVGRVDQRQRLARGLVGQAEDGEIGLVERFAARGDILAARLVEHHQGEFGTARQPVCDLEPGGPGRAIDEDLVGHSSGASAALWT